LCVLLLGPGYDLPTSMSSPTSLARIEWPSHGKIAKMCSMIRSKEPVLINILGLVDCLNLPMQNHWDADLQDGHKNGWKFQCFSSRILVRGHDGCVMYAFLNEPGRCHDSRIAQDLNLELLHLLERRPSFQFLLLLHALNDHVLFDVVNSTFSKEMLIESVLNNVGKDGRSSRLLVWMILSRQLRQDGKAMNQVSFLDYKCVDLPDLTLADWLMFSLPSEEKGLANRILASSGQFSHFECLRGAVSFYSTI